MDSKTKLLDPFRLGEEGDNFRNRLQQLIIAQTEAIQTMVEAFQIRKAGLANPRRTVRNYLFLGPTGVGKTRLLEATALILGESEDLLLKVNCAEFQKSHETAKLIGSPPGYVGHRETNPVFTAKAIEDQVQKMGMGLVLFDEIEKANESLWNLLLGVLDRGTLTLGDNTEISFRSTVIVMTGNIASREVEELVGGLPPGFALRLNETVSDRRVKSTAVKAARRIFSPEFFNRLDKVVVFKKLSEENLRQILDVELGLLQDRIASQGGVKFSFHCTESAKSFLVQQGFDPKCGARHLHRSIQDHLEQPFANLMCSGQIELGTSVLVDFSERDRKLSFLRDTKKLAIGA